ncbi:MAG: polymer-forming cytoskeletal protein [Proteobacteria bacterium]|nr:polymer-forming cytoskeletal protein [Pseudomonadota bacterium]MCH9027007.1 polymer-forming cytoskeletal protein [Pseudomonadota bacterium]
MFGRKKKNPSIDTLIGCNSRVEGDIRFGGGFHVDGYIKGNVKAAAETISIVSISERGVIEGTVSAPEIVLNGTIIGDVVAGNRIVLGPNAKVNGNVYYNLIEMSIGAEVNGKLIHRPGTTTPLLAYQKKVSDAS